MKTTKSEINPAFVMPARADGAAFWVPSRTQDICYLVERLNGALHCSCPARVAQCCHVRAVETRIQQDMQAEPTHPEWRCCSCGAIIEGLHVCPVAEAAAEADRLASLPRTLAEVTTSEEQKLAQIERDAALPKERVLDRQAPSFGRLPLCEMCEEAPASHFDEQPRCDDCQKIAARHALLRAEHAAEKARAHNERAAKREAALLADHTPEEFSIFATPTRHKYERVTEDW